jgi:hypothetical protein
VIDFENRYRHKNGGWRWLLWSAYSDGELWYGVAKDVTDRKELERLGPVRRAGSRQLARSATRQTQAMKTPWKGSRAHRSGSGMFR